MPPFIQGSVGWSVLYSAALLSNNFSTDPSTNSEFLPNSSKGVEGTRPWSTWEIHSDSMKHRKGHWTRSSSMQTSHQTISPWGLIDLADGLQQHQSLFLVHIYHANAQWQLLTPLEVSKAMLQQNDGSWGGFVSLLAHDAQECTDQEELWSTAQIGWKVSGRSSHVSWRQIWIFKVGVWRGDQSNTLKRSIALQVLRLEINLLHYK